jgi:cyclopropane-fatty-acyl-phospholipid synthase
MAISVKEAAEPASSSDPSQSSSSLLAMTPFSYFTTPAYHALTMLSRQACLSLFSRLNQADAHGLLEITEKDGHSTIFGDPTSKRALRRSNAATTATELGSKSVGVNTAPRPEVFTHAVIKVNKESFWLRLVLGNDLGFAESYMMSEIETPDLGACFKLFIENRDVLANLSVGVVSKLSSYISNQLNKRYANTKTGSLRNIGAHYDISNTMYEAFLSKDMTYSCAVFPTLDADVTGPLLEAVNQEAANTHTNGHSHLNGSQRGAAAPLRYEVSSASTTPPGTTNGYLSPETHPGRQSPLPLASDELEDGQLRKLRIHIDRASLKSHHRVLEIGTGWGSFSLEAVRSSGCTVDSLTLSVEQKALAEQRIAAAGLSDKIKVHLMDYRDMPPKWTDYFDRVVSIEMLEAVGIEFLQGYFQCINKVLKKDGGICVIQCITMPEERFETYINSVDFIKKWIFPGGVLPSVTSIIENVEKGSKGTLILDSVHSIGPHYSRTLREWRRRFSLHFDDTIAPALLSDHEEIRRMSPSNQKKEIEIFKKKWLYYFIYCEVGFTERVIGNHILSFTRSGNKTLPVCCA